MSSKSSLAVALIVAAHLGVAPPASAASSDEARNLNELRNTVVNLLQTLVDRGVLTREQAQAMVSSAQEKAAADAATQAEQEKAEAGAVRVPYVPEVVKEEIRNQVKQELAAEVTKDVVQQAQDEQWGIPAALPDWVKRIRWSGDMRMRGQDDIFAPDNITNAYLDFNAVNRAGGIGRAGLAALLNTEEDRRRLRARFRLNMDAELGWGWSMGARLSTGNPADPVSTAQNLGQYGQRYQAGFDLAYLRWAGNSSTGRNLLSVTAGRIQNPWVGTDLVWDEDLTFEGVAANYRLGLMRDEPYSHYAFLTLGAFPIQEVELSADDKWLYGAQMGLDWKLAGGSRARLAVAYYQYENITGQLNSLDSNLLDFTAPQFVQRGNTLFDIRNDTDTATNLYALAADYHIVNATASFEWKVSGSYGVTLIGDYVKNIGYDQQEVLDRTHFLIPKRTSGYRAELAFGSNTLARNGAWRAYVGYKYLEADAVLDAFTDSDFHLGGTDAKGYFVGADYAFTERAFARLRYLSANEIDGPPLGIDVLQLDFNTSF
jgi:hypothetical protein